MACPDKHNDTITEREIDAAVHSLKQIAAELPPEERSRVLGDLDFPAYVAKGEMDRLWAVCDAAAPLYTQAHDLLVWLRRLVDAHQDAMIARAYQQGFAAGAAYDPF